MDSKNKIKSGSNNRYNRTTAVINFIAFCIIALNVENLDIQYTLDAIGGILILIAIVIAWLILPKRSNSVKLSKNESNCMWIFYTLIIIISAYESYTGAVYPTYVNIIIAMFCLSGVTYFALTPATPKEECC